MVLDILQGSVSEQDPKTIETPIEDQFTESELMDASIKARDWCFQLMEETEKAIQVTKTEAVEIGCKAIGLKPA